ncbi:MAG: hypothetical protein RMA76_24155 [Deltaproteobacteria bacterium]|jgi:hypothetical protein
MSPEKRLAQRIAPLILLVGGVVAAFGRVLGPGHLSMLRDHRFAFQDRWWWVVESLGHGRLPVRTLASDTNVPLEHILNGTYTPMTAIFALLPFEVAYDLFVAGHVLLLCGGAFCLARTLGATSTEALASAAFGLSGPLLSFENLLVILQGLAWIPWVLWAVVHLFTARSWRGVGLVALLLGFHLQAITPVAVVVDVVAATFLVYALRRRGAAFDLRVVGLLLIAGALGFTVAAIELVPTLVGLSSTQRGEGFGLASALAWSTPPWGLLELVFPTFFHSPHVPEVAFHDLLTVEGLTHPYLYSLYLGVGLPIALAAVFTRDARDRRLAFVLLLVALFFLAATLGTTLPIYRWLHALPILSNGRYPVKLTVVVAAALAALAPFGLRALARGPRLIALVFVPSIVLAASTVQSLGLPEVHAVVDAALSKSAALGSAFDVAPSQYADLAVASLSASARHALGFGVLAAVVAVAMRRWRALTIVLVVVLFADLAVGSHRHLLAVRTDPPPPPALVEALSDARLRHYVFTPGNRRPKVERLDGESHGEAIYRDEYTRGAGLYGYVRGFDDLDNEGLSHPSSAALFSLAQRARGGDAVALFERAGVRVLASHARMPGDRVRSFEIPNGVPQYVQTIDARPYVALHPLYRYVPEAQLTSRAVFEVMRDDTRRSEAFVTTPGVPAPAVATSSAALTCARTSTATIVETGDLDDIRIDVDLSCPALVSILEVRMPAWRASVDDEPTPIHDADLGFMALHVPAGRHRLRFEYIAFTYDWAAASALGLVIALGLVVLGRGRARP